MTVCSAVYGQLLLHPDGAKAHLPELIAVMEPLAQDPTDASARLGCMSCGIFCRRMRDFRPYHAGVHRIMLAYMDEQGEMGLLEPISILFLSKQEIMLAFGGHL